MSNGILAFVSSIKFNISYYSMLECYYFSSMICFLLSRVEHVQSIITAGLKTVDNMLDFFPISERSQKVKFIKSVVNPFTELITGIEQCRQS